MTDKPNNRNLYAVVGMQHRNKPEGIDVQQFLSSLPNNHPVILMREPGNRFDPNAIQVWVDGRNVGFIPKTQNGVLAKFIDAQGTPVSTLAMDAKPKAGGDPSFVYAKLHWGGNEHPLVEV